MKLLLYCTKTKPILSEVEYCYGDEMKTKYECVSDTKKGNEYLEQMGLGEFLNGKIVGECDFEVEEIYSIQCNPYIPDEFDYKTFSLKPYELEEKSCLNQQQLFDYLTNDCERYTDSGKAIHIKNLKVFDEPKELSDYEQYKYEKSNRNGCYVFAGSKSLEKAPQNMMYVYDDNGYKCILISIHPEWLVKILNGEKTIEIRKKVLKEMLK